MYFTIPWGFQYLRHKPIESLKLFNSRYHLVFAGEVSTLPSQTTTSQLTCSLRPTSLLRPPSTARSDSFGSAGCSRRRQALKNFLIELSTGGEVRRLIIQFDPERLIPLFMSQRNNGIHLRSTGSRIKTENDTDTGTDKKRNHDAPEGDDGRHACNIGYQ